MIWNRTRETPMIWNIIKDGKRVVLENTIVAFRNVQDAKAFAAYLGGGARYMSHEIAAEYGAIFNLPFTENATNRLGAPITYAEAVRLFLADQAAKAALRGEPALPIHGVKPLKSRA